MTTPNDSSLQAALADILPAGCDISYHHISTPPRKCEAIFAAPPGLKEERTYCESHFLNVSIKAPEDRLRTLDNATHANVAIFAIELLVYTTKRLTTVFVSKADSTGYLHLLGLPKGTPSPLRDIAATFISQVVAHRRRKHVDLVLTLFARSADQYLFPGSVENQGKHVADDRQLVKWWCRTLSPLVNRQDMIKLEGEENDSRASMPAQAYIVVPGEESITSFLPDTVKYDAHLRKLWTHGHPLRTISSHPAAPPRCLIPRFPDDPKARFLDQLDEELRDGLTGSQSVEASPSKKGSGQWRSVKSLEQFWEMMAYRQECSSGRLVGFLWVVFPEGEQDQSIGMDDPQDSQVTTTTQSDFNPSTTPQFSSQTTNDNDNHELSDRTTHAKTSSQRRKPLSGLIVPRQPRIKGPKKSSTTASSDMPMHSPYCYWPKELRGDLVLDDRSYEKATDMQGGILSRLDFANLDVAAKGTTTWIDEVGVLSGLPKGSDWGRKVVGSRTIVVDPTRSADNGTIASPNVLSVVKKKRKAEESVGIPQTQGPNAALNGTNSISANVNVLNPSLVRKKQPDPAASVIASSSPTTATTGINTLGAGLIRKKPKVQ